MIRLSPKELQPHELQAIWAQVPEALRHPFVTWALSEAAADRLLAYQFEKQQHNYSGDPYARRSDGSVPVVTLAAPDR